MFSRAGAYHGQPRASACRQAGRATARRPASPGSRCTIITRPPQRRPGQIGSLEVSPLRRSFTCCGGLRPGAAPLPVCVSAQAGRRGAPRPTHSTPALRRVDNPMRLQASRLGCARQTDTKRVSPEAPFSHLRAVAGVPVPACLRVRTGRPAGQAKVFGRGSGGKPFSRKVSPGN